MMLKYHSIIQMRYCSLTASILLEKSCEIRSKPYVNTVEHIGFYLRGEIMEVMDLLVSYDKAQKEFMDATESHRQLETVAQMYGLDFKHKSALNKTYAAAQKDIKKMSKLERQLNDYKFNCEIDEVQKVDSNGLYKVSYFDLYGGWFTMDVYNEEHLHKGVLIDYLTLLRNSKEYKKFKEKHIEK